MGGMGMGGFGSPLLTTLMAGGLGYALGSNMAQPQTQAYPPYPYPAPPPAPQQGSSEDNDRLTQLKLLGELYESGVLTGDEFENQKQRILHGK
jgi:hypothetical protein